MQKILIIITGVFVVGASHAASCPAGWEETPMPAASITTGTTCPSGTTSYFHIDNKCNANVL